MTTQWLNHPLLKNIDPLKLELIKRAAEKTAGKSGNSLAAALMALITSARKKGVRFTPEESSLILEILKEGKSKEERAKIDNLVNTVSSYLKEKK